MNETFSAYARVSTSQQETIEFQKRTIDDYARIKGLTEFSFYHEKKSGKSIKHRLEFQRMLSEAKANNVKFIIVYKLSRAFRNIKDAINCLDEINKIGINFISVSENIDTSTTMGRFLFGLIGLLSQLERENISTNVGDVLNDKIKQGINISKPPYGYVHIGPESSGKLGLDLIKSDQVKKMFTSLIIGSPLIQIAKDNEISINKAVIIISNASYCGWKFYNGQFYKVKGIPQLIEEILYIEAVLKVKDSAMIQKRLGCKSADEVVVLMEKFKAVSNGN